MKVTKKIVFFNEDKSPIKVCDLHYQSSRDSNGKSNYGKTKLVHGVTYAEISSDDDKTTLGYDGDVYPNPSKTKVRLFSLDKDGKVQDWGNWGAMPMYLESSANIELIKTVRELQDQINSLQTRSNNVIENILKSATHIETVVVDFSKAIDLPKE